MHTYPSYYSALVAFMLTFIMMVAYPAQTVDKIVAQETKEIVDNIKDDLDSMMSSVAPAIIDTINQPGTPNVSGTTLESILLKELDQAEITGKELVAFMAQVAHETNNFLSLVEDGTPRYFRRYDPRYNKSKAKKLGNTQAGDGARYKGRGYIQLTGRYNYRIAGKAIGMNLEDYPDVASHPIVAAKIAVWYWQTRVRPRVSNFADVKAVTRPINPGLNGLAARRQFYRDYAVAML